MKYQSQHDLIDPEAPAPALEFGYDDSDDPEVRDDAYVIGAHGESILEPNPQATEEPARGVSPWAKPAAIGLVLLFLVLTAGNLNRLAQGPPAPPKPTPFQAKQALYLGVMRIDAYRRVHGVIPESLAEAGLAAAGAYTYKRAGPTHYFLSFQNGGSKLEYDSNESKELFFGSPKEMLTMGDKK